MIFCSQVVSGAAFGRYLGSFLGILRRLLWMLLKKYVCLCEVQLPYSAQIVCSCVIHVDGGVEPIFNTLLAFSASTFCLFRSVVCASNCLRVHARVSAHPCVKGTLQA